MQAVDNKLVVGAGPTRKSRTRSSSAPWSKLGAEIQFVGELRHSLEDIYLQMIHSEGAVQREDGMSTSKTDILHTIIDKEWSEVFKNRMVLFTVGFMPLVFTIMPLVILGCDAHIRPAAAATCADMPAGLPRCAAPSMRGRVPADLHVNQFMLMFMMMPLAIPMAIAAYSIVGEKTTRSLEPLLATPITTEELLAGKGLAAAIPAIPPPGAVSSSLCCCCRWSGPPAVRHCLVPPG